ncbi:MAG: hypothetical protein U0Q03_10050 [Acidimicrobiales bacterium]
MSRTITRRGLSGLSGLAVAVALALAPAGAAFAQGGSGGGGGGGGGTGGGGGGGTTTTSTGTIKGTYGSAVPCDGGSVLSVTIGKSSTKGVETLLLMSGTTAGWWMFELREDTTGKLWQGHGTTMTELGSTVARLTTATGASLPKGTWNVTYDAVRHDGAFDGPVLESCQATFTILVA